MLKRLELSGFKSFYKKSVLDFSKGISVIIGPNGSGKSNIIDAIRWLLGEREAKNMRGATSDDLIFSGTAKKTRTGMAQAALYLDNSQKILPLDFSEVAVMRRFCRDGTAECFINKSPARLKDIISLFAQAGLGAKGFAVVSQGASDAFIKVSAGERRVMLEEMLGLRQYQLKKREAELKLIHTKQNLEKAQAIIAELLPRLRLLRRQTARWKKRKNFIQELAALKKRYFAARFFLLKKEQNKFAPQLEKLNQEIAQSEKALKKLETVFKKIEGERTAFLTAAAADKRLTLERKLGRLEAQLQFLSAKEKTPINQEELVGAFKNIQELVRQALMLLSNDASSAKDLASVKKILTAADCRINETLVGGVENAGRRQERLEIKKQIDLLRQELKLAAAKGEERQLAAKEFNKSFRRALTTAAVQREKISCLIERRSKLLLAKDRWGYQRRDLESAARQAGCSLVELESKNDKPALGLDIAQAERRITWLERSLAAMGEIDKELVIEAEETEKRFHFLSGQLNDLQKAVVDLEKVIEELDAKIKGDFNKYLKKINLKLDDCFKLLFGGGRSQLMVNNEGVEIEAMVPAKGIKGLKAMSGGEKSLMSIAVLFSLISVAPPPFLVFDEIDSALDEHNSRRFADLLKKFAQQTQFIIVTHNRLVMEAADILYGVTIDADGVSKILSLKLKQRTEISV